MIASSYLWFYSDLPVKFAIFLESSLPFNSFCCFFLFINKTLQLNNLIEQIWKRKFQCLLFMLKRSYICYYIICMTVPLKIFIHSFISCRLPCPNEWFQVQLFWRKYNEKLRFWIWLFLLEIVPRCWKPVEYIQKITISFFTVLLDEMIHGVRHIKVCKI